MARFTIDYKNPTTMEKCSKYFLQIIEYASIMRLFDTPRLQFGYVETPQGTKIISPNLSNIFVSSETIDGAYEEARRRAKEGKLEKFEFSFESQSDDLL